MPTVGVQSLLWFVAIVAAIPLALWLLKRSALGAGAGSAAMRSVGVLALSGGQRIVTVEVGQGEDRRWLVLGVTAQQITTLHTMAPQAAPATASVPGSAFAPLLQRAIGRAPGHASPREPGSGDVG